MGVWLSDEEWDFLYSTFETLCTHLSADEQMVDAVVSEHRIWRMLQGVESRRLRAGQESRADPSE